MADATRYDQTVQTILTVVRNIDSLHRNSLIGMAARLLAEALPGPLKILVEKAIMVNGRISRQAKYNLQRP